MIEVTRLNGLVVVINADLIQFIEATPDTVISLSTGEKIMVREAVAEVAERARHYQQLLCRAAGECRRARLPAPPGNSDSGRGCRWEEGEAEGGR